GVRVVESALAGVVERTQVMPLAERDLGGSGRWFLGAAVAVEPQAVITVAEEDVGLAVAIVVDPGGRADGRVRLLRQEMTVIAERIIAEVGVELDSRGRGQEQVWLAVAVIVRPDGGPGARGAWDVKLAERFAAVLQQDHPAAAGQAQVHPAVAVEIHAGDR